MIWLYDNEMNCSDRLQSRSKGVIPTVASRNNSLQVTSGKLHCNSSTHQTSLISHQTFFHLPRMVSRAQLALCNGTGPRATAVFMMVIILTTTEAIGAVKVAEMESCGRGMAWIIHKPRPFSGWKAWRAVKAGKLWGLVGLLFTIWKWCLINIFCLERHS